MKEKKTDGGILLSKFIILSVGETYINENIE